MSIYMLFRKHDGTIIEIKRNQFTNDSLYYQHLLKIKMGMNISRNVEVDVRSGNSSQVIHSLLQSFK